jgi:peptide chain release factor subunit 1
MEQIARLRKIISDLEKIRGRHTELVTVYVPAGFSLNNIAEQIRSEQSTAQNIKSKTVRKNVMSALERITQHIKLYKQTPDNGLAIFSGNVSEKEGVSDIEIWAIEPPMPLKQRLYRCDQKFVLDALKDMVREKEIYGLIVIDGSEADIGMLRGKRVEVLKHVESWVPGKTSKGGWSQARYARIRENLLREFLKKVGDVASSSYKELKDLKGLIVAGPGPVKDEFVNGKFLDYTIQSKILGLVDTSYTGQYGLEEAVNRGENLLAEASVIKEKQILNRFFTEFAKDSGLAVYGINETVSALQAGNLELLLLSESFDYVKSQLECQCGFKTEKVTRKKFLAEMKCPKCGSQLNSSEEDDVTDEIIKHAERMGTQVEMISKDTKEGKQLEEMGGIGGILRYKA